MAIAIAITLLSRHQLSRHHCCPMQLCRRCCRLPLWHPLSPIAATIAHHDHAAVPPSMMLELLSTIAVALLLCNHASPLDVPPPLHMPAGCHVGLVVLASSLVMLLPLKAPAHCPHCLLMHNPLVCPVWSLRHLATTTASQCAGLLSPPLSLRHPLACPAWLSHHPLLRHRLSTHCCCN
jgi:hypothetical protein